MPYIGKSPSAGVRQRYQYTATAGQTTFSGTDLGNLTLTYTDNNFVDVFQNGVLLKGGGTDYTATSGTSVVLTTGASVSDVIEIIVYDVFSVGNFYNRTDSDSRYALKEGNVVFNETSDNVDFRVESNGNANMLFVDGGNDRVGIGTSSPSTPLHVLGNNGILVDDAGNGDGQIYFGGISGSDRTYLARSSDDFLIWNVANGTIKFGTNNSERLRILAGGGITFNGDTADANGLDDYEEGTHQTAVSMATSGTVTLNTSFDRFSYTKVGRLVTITGNPRIASVSSPVGSMSLTLPFTAASGQTDECRSGGMIRYYDNSAGSGAYNKPMGWSIQEGTSTISIVNTNTHNNNVTPAASDEFYFCVSYITAT